MAAGACISDLEQQLDRSWSGRVLKTGESKAFRTLNDYDQYTKSLEQQGSFCPNVEKKYLAEFRPGKNTTVSGFLEFQPRDPIGQAKHSAMSPSWEGVQSSETAIARGDYDLDQAEKIRKDLRSKQPQPRMEMPNVQPAWNCSIQ